MLDWLKTRIIEVVSWFFDLFLAVFEALVDMLRDMASWAFEQVMDLVIGALNKLDISGLDSVSGWGEMPSQIVSVLGLMGVGEAGAIILAAITIRLIMQLIPFTRLGS